MARTLKGTKAFYHMFLFIAFFSWEVPAILQVPHISFPSYHQKYLLRQQRDILQSLKLSDADLVTSHTACRLNGFCGGYGTLDQLETELPGFKLDPKVEERVKKIVSRGRMH